MIERDDAVRVSFDDMDLIRDAAGKRFVMVSAFWYELLEESRNRRSERFELPDAVLVERAYVPKAAVRYGREILRDVGLLQYEPLPGGRTLWTINPTVTAYYPDEPENGGAS